MKRRLGTAYVERDFDPYADTHGTSPASTDIPTSGLGPEQGTWGMTAEAAGLGPEYGPRVEDAFKKPTSMLLFVGLGVLAVGLVLMSNDGSRK